MKGETIYSFPGEPDGTGPSPFRLQMTGISRCDASYRIARRPSEIFVFEYIMKGRGRLEIDGKSLEPCAGDVYFIDGRLAHSYWSSAEDPWVKIWFNVEGELVPSLLSLYGFGGVHLFKDCPLEHVFVRGFETARDNPASAQKVAALCVHELALELSKRVAAPWRLQTVVPEAAARVKEAIDASPGSPPSLAKLCRASGMSVSQTLRLFKKAYGSTPLRYALDRRISSAKLLLSNSAKSVKEISVELGFADEYYFSNVFKARTGVPPTRYRKLSR